MTVPRGGELFGPTELMLCNMKQDRDSLSVRLSFDLRNKLADRASIVSITLPPAPLTLLK